MFFLFTYNWSMNSTLALIFEVTSNQNFEGSSRIYDSLKFIIIRSFSLIINFSNLCNSLLFGNLSEQCFKVGILHALEDELIGIAIEKKGNGWKEWIKPSDHDYFSCFFKLEVIFTFIFHMYSTSWTGYQTRNFGKTHFTHIFHLKF